MRVTRIEIFGFKSFMERLILPLEAGVTGVVGPNGCGKSNIVDALRWVLGETKARNLRGGTLEDVIFNGTDKLRPLGLAEVSLTLRSRGESLFADIVEVDSETEILTELAAAEEEVRERNKTLKKTAEQIEGIGSDEGQTASSEQPVQDMPLTSNQEETDRELREEQTDAPVEAQLEGSGEGSARPKLTVILGKKAPEAEIFSGQEENHEGEQQRLAEERLPAEAVDAQSEEAVSVSQAKSEEQKRKLPPPAALVHKFSWLKAASEVQVTRRLYRSGESEYFINRVPCRLRDLKELFRASGISARAYTLVAQGQVSRIVTAKPEERRVILEEAAGIAGFRDKIQAAQRRLADTAINISRIEDIHKEVVRQVNSLKRQAARAKNRQALKEELRELDFLLFAYSQLNNERSLELAQQKLEEAQQGEEGCQASLEKAQSQESFARSELMRVDVEGDELRSKIDAFKEEINNRARRRSEKKSRLNELAAFELSRQTELERMHERQKTLEEREESSRSQLVELEQRANELQKQIEEIGDAGEAELELITSSLRELEREVRIAEGEFRTAKEQRARVEGELSGLKRQLLAASPLSKLKQAAEKGILSQHESLRMLIDGIEVKPDVAKALESVLQHRAAYLVSENPHAVARDIAKTEMAQKEGAAYGIVRSGELEQPLEFDPSIPFVSLWSEIRVEPAFSRAASLLLHSIYLVESVEEAFSFFEQEPESICTLVTRGGDILDRDSFFRFRHEGGVVQIRSQIEALQAKSDDLEQRIEEQEKTVAGLRGKETSTREKREELLAIAREKQRRAKELGNELGSVRGRRQSLVSGLDQIRGDQERLLHQIREAKERIQEFRSEKVLVQQELDALVPDDEKQLHAEVRELQAEYLELDEVRQKNRNELSQFVQAVERERQVLDDVRKLVSDQQLQVQRLSMESGHNQERIEEEYGLSEFEVAAEQFRAKAQELSDEQVEKAKEERSRIRSRIAREGEVDPSSIERYEEESKRLEELESQKKDLESASDTLSKTVERLKATSQERFVKTFERVQRNFEKLIPRLFGGGMGSLELIDPENPLESGVSITTRPPGKKPKSIDLLSGGEKALCATALIFSMFLVRPSPLCVLDEVDAPLDEANLVRFLSLVKEMSDKTQFIMITHNKGSMAAADKLVGVTMEQPGATKVISVSLQEAYEQVA